MANVVGQNCEIILDGTGYFIYPASYHLKWPRIRKATIRADAGEGYVDLGQGKREWLMTLLCLNDLTNLDGSKNTNDGEAFRTAIWTSYTKGAGSTVSFTDAKNTTYTVHIDSYAEQILDIRGAQQVAIATGGASPRMSYLVAIVLVEA